MDDTAVETSRIRQSAAAAFAAMPGSRIQFTVGNLQRVFSLEGNPAYWLAAGLVDGQIQAIARILEDGRVATVGNCKSPATDCAQAVTGLSAHQAKQLMKDLAAQYRGSEILPPTLVHDGPVGREAWLYHARSNKQDNWIFATAGGTYSRPAGTPLP
jgi:hypothetical protein